MNATNPANAPQGANVEPIGLDLKTAAKLVGVSDRHLWGSDCPRIRLGRRIVFLRDDLIEWLRSKGGQR